MSASSVSGAADPSTEFTGQAYMSKGNLLRGGHFEQYSYHPRILGPNDVEVAITHCGVCASDHHTVKGGWGDCMYPCIPGHEIVGTVTKVGSAVSMHKPGDRVGVGPHVLSCMKDSCEYCSKKETNLCKQMVLTYNAKYPDGEVAQGGYATGIRVHEYFAIPLPASMDSATVAPLLCAGITVFAPLKHYKAGQGKKVGIVGVGGLGHVAVQFAAKMGAETIAISSSKRKEQDALKLGASQHVDINNDEEVKTIEGKLDLVICTANGPSMDYDKYIGLCKPKGTFVLIGIPEKPLTIKAANLVMHGITLAGSIIGSIEETKEMLKFADEHNVKPIIEHMKMKEADEAFKKMEKGDIHFRVVLEN